MNIADIHNPWRDSWRQASFKGAPFFVEAGGVSGGRRIVLHEFPKRDDPYAEDMGRRGKIFNVVGYLIGPNYKDDRDRLETALDSGAGALVLPTRSDMKANCLRYASVERRIAGGYCEIEMTFVEAGSSGVTATASTSAKIKIAANAAAGAASNALNGVSG